MPALYRRRVHADAGRVTPGFAAAKAGVARRHGGRFGPAAFVTGALDPVRDRGAFLALVDLLPAPTLVVYGADTPSEALAEMEALARVPGIASHRLAVGSLGLHEERAHAGAAAVRLSLLGEPGPGMPWPGDVRPRGDR